MTEQEWYETIEKILDANAGMNLIKFFHFLEISLENTLKKKNEEKMNEYLAYFNYFVLLHHFDKLEKEIIFQGLYASTHSEKIKQIMDQLKSLMASISLA
jgi:hypothetical protein